jgi:hypothetical protein
MACLALGILLLLVPAVPAQWSPETARDTQTMRKAYDRIAEGRLPVDIELLSLAVGLRSTGEPDDKMRAALIELLWAQRLGVDTLRGLQRVIAARKDLETALAVRPANGHGWMKLAIARVLMDEPREAERALAASLATSGPDPALTALQLDLAVVLWDALKDDTKQSLEKRLKWIAGQPSLKDLEHSHAATVLRRKLDPGLNH